jgi:predicted nuclease of restriction endonuclease-like RecB superfamily
MTSGFVTVTAVFSRNKYLMSEWRKAGFDSKFEYDVYQSSVKSRTKHHDGAIAYTTMRMYHPDFKIKTRSGKQIFIETKGYWTGADRSKHLSVVHQNPNIDLRLVFMNARNRLNKTSKTTYAAWCDKRNIKWAEGSIPREWYNE